MRVLGVRCWGLMFRVEGIGCVIREWSEDVRLGMMRLLSPWSRVLGRASRSPVRGLVKDEWALREGAIVGFDVLRNREMKGFQARRLRSYVEEGCKRVSIQTRQEANSAEREAQQCFRGFEVPDVVNAAGHARFEEKKRPRQIELSCQLGKAIATSQERGRRRDRRYQPSSPRSRSKRGLDTHW